MKASVRETGRCRAAALQRTEQHGCWQRCVQAGVGGSWRAGRAAAEGERDLRRSDVLPHNRVAAPRSAAS
eukprot:4275668-Prymnesium_polylepis.1